MDLIVIKSIYTNLAGVCTDATGGELTQNEVRVYFNQCTEQGGCGAGGGVVATDKLFFPKPGMGPNDTWIDALDSNQKMAVIYRDGNMNVYNNKPVFDRYYTPDCSAQAETAKVDCCNNATNADHSFDIRAPFTRLAVAYKTVVVNGNNRNVVDYILVSRRYQGQDSFYQDVLGPPAYFAGRILHLRNPFTGANPGEAMLPWPSKNGRNLSVYAYDGNMSSHNNRTAEAMTFRGTDYTVLTRTYVLPPNENQSDFFYVGDANPFGAVDFGFGTPASGIPLGSLVVQYWNGTVWTSFPAFTPSTTIVDGTYTSANGHLSRDGAITFVPPSDWAANSPGGALPNKYWIRLYVTAAATTWPTAYWTVTTHPGNESNFACATSDTLVYRDDYTFRVPIGDVNFRVNFNAFDLGDLNNTNGADIYTAPHYYHTAGGSGSGNQLQYTTAIIYRYLNDGTNNFNNAYNNASPAANYLWGDSSSPAGIKAQMFDMHIVDMDKDGIPDILSLLGSGGTYRLSWVQGQANGSLSGDLKTRQIGDGGTIFDVYPGNLRTKSGDPWPADNPKGSPDLVIIRNATPKIEISMYSDWKKKGEPPSVANMSEWITVYDATVDPDYENLASTWMRHVGFSRVTLADVDGCGMNEIIAITGGGFASPGFAGRAQFWIFKNSKSTHSQQYLTMNAR